MSPPTTMYQIEMAFRRPFSVTVSVPKEESTDPFPSISVRTDESTYPLALHQGGSIGHTMYNFTYDAFRVFQRFIASIDVDRIKQLRGD